MTIDIRCPNCQKSYRVTEQHIGKKVVCASKECGTTFFAASDPSADDALDVSELATDEEAMSFESQSTRDKSSRPLLHDIGLQGKMVSREGDVEIGSMRRPFLFCGLLTLVITVLYPTINPATGDFSPPRGTVKQSALIVGMTFMLIGTLLWSKSNARFTQVDVLILAVGIGVIMCILIYKMLGTP